MMDDKGFPVHTKIHTSSIGSLGPTSMPGRLLLAGGRLPRSKRFECTHCGVCCRSNMKGERKVSRDDSGILYTMDQGSWLTALWRWEADRLRKKAHRLGKAISIRPLSFIVDKKGGQAIILLWYMDHKVCPFHEDDRCAIWEERPFNCKIFPLFGHRDGIGLSSMCPDLVRPPMGDDEEGNGKKIMEAYPQEVTALFKDMQVFKMITGFLRDLEKNEVIEWDREAAVETGSLLIGSKDTRTDLFDLVIDAGVLSRERLESIFKELDSVDDVSGRVTLKISRQMAGI